MSWAEPKGEGLRPSFKRGRQRKRGTAEVEQGADGAIGEGGEDGIGLITTDIGARDMDDAHFEAQMASAKAYCAALAKPDELNALDKQAKGKRK